MKPTDLRIGNWISQYGCLYKIKIGRELDDLKDCEPIPITEEWLKDLGGKYETGKREGYWFKAGEYEMCVTVNAFTPGKIDEEAKWFVSIQTGYGSQPVTVVKQFVHEFQNLYHALTGEDLKTNEQ